MMKQPLLWILLALCCGCSARNPKFCGDGICSDPELPFCDKDGSLEGAPDTCIAVTCSPGTFKACRGIETLVCNASGDDFDIIQCATGCKEGVVTCNPC